MGIVEAIKTALGMSVLSDYDRLRRKDGNLMYDNKSQGKRKAIAKRRKKNKNKKTHR